MNTNHGCRQYGLSANMDPRISAIGKSVYCHLFISSCHCSSRQFTYLAFRPFKTAVRRSNSPSRVVPSNSYEMGKTSRRRALDNNWKNLTKIRKFVSCTQHKLRTLRCGSAVPNWTTNNALIPWFQPRDAFGTCWPTHDENTFIGLSLTFILGIDLMFGGKFTQFNEICLLPLGIMR